jgi:hypothetical protein
MLSSQFTPNTAKQFPSFATVAFNAARLALEMLLPPIMILITSSLAPLARSDDSIDAAGASKGVSSSAACIFNAALALDMLLSPLTFC